MLRYLRVDGYSATTHLIRDELRVGLTGLLGKPPTFSDTIREGTLIAGSPGSSPAIASMGMERGLDIRPDGFVIRTVRHENHNVIAIASPSEIGALYGTFHFLRMLQSERPIERLNIHERPRLDLRMVNHWDNLDGTIERGYAGRSLWKWPIDVKGDQRGRYLAYARANASLGINGMVLNNVNANPRILDGSYLQQIEKLAALWRPYGLRVYLSANFSAPVTLGRLASADPLDPAVIEWWKKKADEIYALIPDFGGFLVKANSEGQPGPRDYGRTHAQGANLLANALAPHKGTVIWRAFVYDEDIDPDRAKRAYIEFMKLDGQFRPNVLLQIKNGPIDFQPREPFHPLFGALKQTPVIAEVQATQEYLGQAKHLVYLGTMWKEFLESDTQAKGPGSTVGRVLEGSVNPQPVTGMAGVLNCGSDANWCGHHFSQANWYAFGRLAWDHTLSAEAIANEWIRQTFGNNPKVISILGEMMMASREIFVNYTMPLGLHHLIGGDHYAPMPWNAEAQRRDWTAIYYHQASPEGIGFDRTRGGGGDKAVEQYFPAVCDLFDNLATCPERFLLWFHRLPWNHVMPSGRTLWQELCGRYQQGAENVGRLQEGWMALTPLIDQQRHREVAARLAIQVADAAKWRDQILAYFQRFSGMPIPAV